MKRRFGTHKKPVQVKVLAKFSFWHTLLRSKPKCEPIGTHFLYFVKRKKKAKLFFCRLLSVLNQVLPTYNAVFFFIHKSFLHTLKFVPSQNVCQNNNLAHSTIALSQNVCQMLILAHIMCAKTVVWHTF